MDSRSRIFTPLYERQEQRSSPPSPSIYMIRPEDLDIDQAQALDDHGYVYRAMMDNEQRVGTAVVKILSRSVPSERNDAWRSLDHQNVLKVFGVSDQYAEPPFVVSEYHRHGNIISYIDSNPLANRCQLAEDMARGMQYLHECGIVHGNLKSSDVLVAEDGRACIADYEMKAFQSSRNDEAYRYYSPEAWSGVISRPADVFAFAMCAYEIFSSMKPWGDLAKEVVFRKVVNDHKRPIRPDRSQSLFNGLTDEIWGIIEESWNGEARFRPTFDIIVKMWPGHLGEDPGASTCSAILERSLSLVSRPRPVLPPVETGSFSCPPAYQWAPTPISALSPMTPSSRRIRPLPLIPTMHGKYVASSTVTVTGAGSGSHPSSAECSTPSATDSSSSSSPSFPVSPRTDSLLSSPIPISRPHSSNGRAREISGCPGPDSYEIVHPIPRKGGITHQPMSSQNSDGELEEDLVYGFIFRSMSPLVLHRTSTSQPSTISRPFLDRPSMLAKRRSSSMSNLSQVAGMQNAVSVAVQKPPLPDPDPNLNTYTVYTDAGPVILAGALQAVVQARDEERIGAYLLKIYRCATSGGDTEHVITKFIEAGTVSIIVSLLMARVGEEERYEGEDLLPVLASLGALAQNPVGSTVIFRMNACATLMGLFRSPSENVASLATWCLTRACARNKHVATTLSKQGLPRLLLKHGLGSRYKHQHHTGIVARYAAWCLGNLVQHTENEAFAKPDVITGIIDYLRRTSSPSFVQGSVGSDIPAAEDTCSALFLLSRISRSAKISKQLAKGGCIPYVAHHLNTSHHPDILRWSARAVGCLLRPNSSEIARELLKAGVANGLTRLPRVIAPNDIEPLGPFAFAIQRFCYAEWGGGTRKVLVDAGVVDSLLSALRIAVDSAEASVSSAPTSACVQIELAMAISCLGDFGGKKVRKEILNAGGLLVLKRLASIAGPGTEVEKVCNMAVKSVSGNVVTRNAVKIGKLL